MAFDATCSRLRMGGTLAGSVISGGTVIDAGGIAIETYSGIWGIPGRRGADSPLLNVDGERFAPGKPYRARDLTLNFVAYDTDATGVITLSDGRREHLEFNRDAILGLLTAGSGRVILEQDVADGTGPPISVLTRFIEIEVLTAAEFSQGPIFDTGSGSYRIPVFVHAAYPMWQSEVLTTAVAPATIVNAGNGRISNTVINATGAGTMTHDDGDEQGPYSLITNAACDIDIGRQRVTLAGVLADNLMDPPERDFWMRFEGGITNVTVPGGWTVQYRDHFV